MHAGPGGELTGRPGGERRLCRHPGRGPAGAQLAPPGEQLGAGAGRAPGRHRQDAGGPAGHLPRRRQLVLGRAREGLVPPGQGPSASVGLRPEAVGRTAPEALSPGPFVFGPTSTTEALGHGLSVWYKTTAGGFEQGFSLSRRPPGVAGRFSIVLGYSGGVRLSATGPGGLSISGPAGPLMTYSGLRASDATGRALPAQLSSGPGQVRIVVDDARAVYPLRIDPFVAPAATPTASFTGSGGGTLGWSVALSADGQAALVGDPVAGDDNGAAYVYQEAAGAWPTTPTASFAGTGSEDLGTSVALSADGQAALVGAPAAGSGNGAAYLYAEAAGAWPSTPAASFTGTGGGNFGYSVALSADGQAALVGAPEASSFDGGAYLYAEAAGAWPTTPAASFAGTGSEELGWSVALSADGQAALVGPVR